MRQHMIWRYAQWLSPLLLACAMLTGCDTSIADRLAALAAAEKSLNISPMLFATKFNSTLYEIFADRQEADPQRIAVLYAIDVTQLQKRNPRHVLRVQVGPEHSAIIGSIAADNNLRAVGVLLTESSASAREAFYLCAETISRVVTDGARDKFPKLIRRMTRNALDSPGQRIIEIIGDRSLSVEVTITGVLFQIEHK